MPGNIKCGADMPTRKRKPADGKPVRKTLKAGVKPLIGRKPIGKRLPVRLPDDLRTRLQAIGEPLGLPEAAIIRRACENYVRQKSAGEELADIEQRIARTLDRVLTTTMGVLAVARDTHDYVHMQIALTDELTRFLYGTIPPLLPDGARAPLRSKRYKKLTERLERAFVPGSKRSRLAASISNALDAGDVQLHPVNLTDNDDAQD